MKTKMITQLLILFIVKIFSQTENEKAITKKYLYNEISQNLFSEIIIGEKNTMGTSAFLDTKKIGFTFNLNKNSPIIYNLKLGGKDDDGLLNFINSKKINPNFTIDLAINILVGNGKIYHNKISQFNYEQKNLDIIRKHDEKYTKIINDIDLNESKEKLKKLASEINTLEKNEKDKQILAYKNEQKKILEKDIEFREKNKEYFFQTIDNERDDELSSNKIKYQYEAFKLSWFSVNYNLSNRNFKLIDEVSTYDSQISKANNVNHSLTFQYNIYNYYNKDTFDSKFADSFLLNNLFLILGAKVIYGDNFEDLNKTNIEEYTIYQENDIERKVVSNSYSAYIGEYKKNEFSAKIFVDFYKFFGQYNDFGIHLSPEVTISNKTITNFTTGLFYSFKNQNEKNSKVNIELFTTFSDLFKTNDFLTKNQYGFRINLPFKNF